LSLKHPPRTATDARDRFHRDPWKRLREKPGVKVLDVARRSPRER
jgi:hypothetical protein